MDISDIGARYLDNARFTPAMGITRQNPETPAGGIFAGLLEKAEAAEDAQSVHAANKPADPARVSSKKPVVDKTEKLYEQCEALETFLVKTLITGMRNTIQKSNLLDEGFAGKMYEDMLYDEYAKDFSKNANFGLAELAYLELTGQRGKLLT